MPAVNRDDPLVPEVEVNINGSPLSVDAAAHLMAVTVDNDVDLPDMFTLDFVGADDQEQLMPWVDDDLFAIGNAIEIKLGYAQNLLTVINGEITGLEPAFVFDRFRSGAIELGWRGKQPGISRSPRRGDTSTMSPMQATALRYSPS